MRPVPEFENVNFREFEMQLISRARRKAVDLALNDRDFRGLTMASIDGFAVELTEHLCMEMLTMDQDFVIKGYV